MHTSSDNIDPQIEPTIHTSPDRPQPDDGSNPDNLPVDLFDEIHDSEPVLHAPEITATADGSPVADKQPPQLQDKPQSSYLLAGAIMAILVAGIGYYLSATDNAPSDTKVHVENSGQEPHTGSQVLKPIPIPDMAGGETKNKATISNPQGNSYPTVEPKRQTLQTAPAQSPSTQTPPTSKKPKSIILKDTSANRKPASPQPEPTRSAWAVNLMALSNHDSALKVLRRLRAKGFNPELERVKTGGRTFYRVRIANLPGRKAAEKTRDRFRAMPEYRHAWINHYKK